MLKIGELTQNDLLNLDSAIGEALSECYSSNRRKVYEELIDKITLIRLADQNKTINLMIEEVK